MRSPVKWEEMTLLKSEVDYLTHTITGLPAPPRCTRGTCGHLWKLHSGPSSHCVLCVCVSYYR